MNDLITLLNLASAGALSFCLAGSAATILAMLRDKTPLRPSKFDIGIAALPLTHRAVVSSHATETVITPVYGAANEVNDHATERAA